VYALTRICNYLQYRCLRKKLAPPEENRSEAVSGLVKLIGNRNPMMPSVRVQVMNLVRLD
jgi:hypothetical protein